MVNENDIFHKYGIDRFNEEIQKSLTLKSYLEECKDSKIKEDYERLEFLGDRVANEVAATFLYSYEHNPVGVMAKQIECLISNDAHYEYSMILRIARLH